MITNTDQTKIEIAFNFFNDVIFEGSLEKVLITFQRKGRACGYFSPNRFQGRVSSSDSMHELAMNPDHFDKTDIEILQTLVHEMCHLWQEQKGKPSRNGYHNKEFANKMEEVGLMTSDTGQPGGKRTGQRMSDYAIEGGKFVTAAKEFLQENDTVEWCSISLGKKAASAGKNKIKYSCSCGCNIWGKEGLDLSCNVCGSEFEESL